MKGFILIALLAVGMMAGAQTYSYSFSTNGHASGHFWDYADTTSNGDTINAVIRVKSDVAMNLRFQILNVEVSGTATAKAAIWGSNDGVTYIATGDSITDALTDDGSIWVLCRNFNYSYAKLEFITAGTETSTAKCYYSFRKE